MKRAYVTLLCDDSRIYYVLSLYQCLINVNAKYPLYCLVSEKVSYKVILTLIKNNIGIIPVNTIDAKKILEDASNLDFGYVANDTFTKLHIFNCNCFDKIVYLDSDLYIVQNIDELFDRPHMSGCLNASNVRDEFDYTYGLSSENTIFNWINAGVMVVDTHKTTLADIINFMKTYYEDIFRVFGNNTLITDQDIICLYFSQHTNYWDTHDYLLSYEFNLDTSYMGSYLEKKWFNMKNIKIWHFTGSNKPPIKFKNGWDLFLPDAEYLVIYNKVKEENPL